MSINDEFEQIVDSAAELKPLGAFAPDGVMVIVAVDGTEFRLPRITFMEHANAVYDVLRDPTGDLKGVMGPVAGLEPLVRRVVLDAAWQNFKDWYLEKCPVDHLPFAVFHMPMFSVVFRELTANAPEFDGNFRIEGGLMG